jgi:CheY-like chemotaxis protein
MPGPALKRRAVRLFGRIGMDAPACKRRILIVDDCGHCSTTLGRVVTLLGHEVRTSRDGVEGVEAASEFRPQVVLVDLGLPGLDGYEVARSIRGRPWGTGVTMIALTAFGQGIDEPRFQEAGFDHHLAKPVDFEALVRLIGRSLPPSGGPPKL